MSRERADIGFSDALDGFDPAEWRAGGTPPRPPAADSRQAAAATGFVSRQPPAAAPAGGAGGASGAAAEATRIRGRRTGRNAQFNLKARPETIAAFCAVADAKGWGLGETLEHAVALLQREYGGSQGKLR